jgi:hypothetical protein
MTHRVLPVVRWSQVGAVAAGVLKNLADGPVSFSFPTISCLA